MADSTRSRAEEVADLLGTQILRAQQPAGTRLGLRTELIDHFQVSPGVMNEALRLLRERGLIVVKPGPSGGVFAADLPPGVRLGALDLWFQGLPASPLEVFESRGLLEDMFSNLAIDRAEPADLRAMRHALTKMDEKASDPRGWFEATVHFHQAIARGTHFTVLVGIYDALIAVLLGALVRAEYTGDHERMIAHSMRVHAQLLEAITSRDRGRLAAATALHRRDLISIIEPERSPHILMPMSKAEADTDATG